ncbi:MAG: NUDIX hydrolase [bacterium]|nr:NUDIX hydrolase [bacterium]
MPEPKLSKSSNGEPMHFSVGALIEKDGKYLLIERAKPPLGFALVAGHVDEGEEPEVALKREVKEESGLDLESFELITEGELDDTCRRGIAVHYWHLYKCEVSGEIVHNDEETLSIGWYTKEEMQDLDFEPACDFWLKKLKLI